MFVQDHHRLEELQRLTKALRLETGTRLEMKKVVSGGPVRAIAFPQADAGLPGTTFFRRRSQKMPCEGVVKTCLQSPEVPVQRVTIP